MASSDSTTVSGATIASGLAQPVINAIQAQISTFLPSNLASAITSQSAAEPAQPMGSSDMPGSASGDLSLGQQAISGFLQDINTFLPSNLAAAITSQLSSASGSSTGGSAMLHFMAGAPPVLTFDTASASASS